MGNILNKEKLENKLFDLYIPTIVMYILREVINIGK